MATEIIPSLSIVMPIYNEQECIESVIVDIHSAILSKLPGSELLAINDGSTDSTPAILDNLAKRLSQVIPLHKENGGHGDALLYGLERATGKYIFLTDSDGQTDPRDFWSLWNRRDGADFITGVRFKRYDPLHRLLIARLLRYTIVMFFGARCSDANVPFKLFTNDFWQTVNAFIPPDTLTPSLFLSIAAKSCLNGVEEVHIRHLPRATGTCTIRYFRLLRFCLRSFYQFLKFRYLAWPAMVAHQNILEGQSKIANQ